MIIGAVIADDHHTAHEAAMRVKVDYEDLPSIGSLEVILFKVLNLLLFISNVL